MSPPSKRAISALPETGDRPGRDGVTSTMAGVAFECVGFEIQQQNHTIFQKDIPHPPTLGE
jgi:hypothetical protein